MPHILSNFFLVWIIGYSLAWSQITARLEVKSDTIPLGRPIEAILIVQAPQNLSIIYPDTLIDFKPYEFIHLRMTSAVSGTKKFDTLTYSFRTFETAPLQVLNLSVFALLNKDTIASIVLRDSFRFSSRLPVNKDSVDLKYHQDVIIIESPPDYLTMVLFVCIGIFMIAITIVILYKPVRRWIKKYRLKNEFNSLVHRIQLLDPLKSEEFIHHLNLLIKGWYSEDLPIKLDSLTTTEIKSLQAQEVLLTNELNFIIDISEKADMILYAGDTHQAGLTETYKQKAIQMMKGKLEKRLKAIQ